MTDVVPGAQATLCDAVDLQAPPIVVRERSGTRNLEPGMRLGCRVMTVQDHFELSGCAYPAYSSDRDRPFQIDRER